MNRSWILDNVSMIDNTMPSVELLSNPDFEDSTTSIPGWVRWCSSFCSYGTSGVLLSGADCYLGSGNCFTSACLGTNMEFLGQTFSTTPGSIYTLSLELTVTGTDGYYYTLFTVDIL